jgi:phage shock protein PspC (stress-responsive transcriptional regulator)
MNLADELQKLQSLREQGALTEEEFVQAKRRILEGEPSPAREQAGPKPASGLHRLKRSLSDRWIGGVCGGLAELTDMPAWTWRILFVLAILLHGLGILVYLLLWIFVPPQAEPPRPVGEESRQP